MDTRRTRKASRIGALVTLGSVLFSGPGCRHADEPPPPQTPTTLDEPRPKLAEPAPCIDGVELVLRAPSRAGFAPGVYEVELDFEGQERTATCEIRSSDADSSCQPLGHSTSAFYATLGKNGQTIDVIATAHPQDIAVDVRRDKRSIARTTISPRYEAMETRDGRRCTTAFVALGLR